MLETDGIISKEQFEQLLPTQERRKKGPYVIMECIQKIPCDPCTASCKVGAVILPEITDAPQVNYERCVGCTACVGHCPGQACFVIDETLSDEQVLITLPYEMLPFPQIGSSVVLLGRDGRAVGTSKIEKMYEVDKTYVVSVFADKKLLYDVRAIRIAAEEEEI